MHALLPFLLVLVASVFSAAIFRRFHLPWVIALIVGGIVIGPQVLNVYQANPTINFLADIGLVFLMFMAGLETKLSSFSELKSSIYPLSFINGFVPMLVGLGIAILFGYPMSTALLLATIFVSSSVAVVIPSLESTGLMQSKLGQAVMSTSIIQDVASLVLLSLILQSYQPTTFLPLYLFYPLVLASLIILRWLIPQVQDLFCKNIKAEEDLFQQEFRAIFLILIATTALFELLGLHAIIAGFFTGLVLSESIESDILKIKLRAIGYGIFIPTFFVYVGTQTDILVFTRVSGAVLLTVVILLGSLLSKLLSGTLGAKLVGFNWKQSTLFGVSSIPQLSTTLAAAFSAQSIGLLTEEILTALIILSVVTTLISPTLMGILSREVLGKKDLKMKKQLK